MLAKDSKTVACVVARASGMVVCKGVEGVEGVEGVVVEREARMSATARSRSATFDTREGGSVGEA